MSKNIANYSSKSFLNSRAQYSKYWELTDQTLYNLCQENFDHNSLNSINAKLWIIGRTYATGIERNIPTDGKQGGSLTSLAQQLHKKRNKINQIFKKLRNMSESLNVDSLRVISILHWEFTQIIKQVTRKNHVPRSFASKYMHFHCPAVPIYDNYTARALKILVPWREELLVFDKSPNMDEEYLWHILRFWNLYKTALQNGNPVKVKHLDFYLLCVAEKLAGQKIRNSKSVKKAKNFNLQDVH
jgi:hypothetical protein